MVDTEDGPQRAFIAGYTDITNEEFATHYQEELDDAIQDGHSFLLSDEPGACTIAFQYLKANNVSGRKITIYRSTSPSDNDARQLSGQFKDASVVTIAGGEAERLAAMSEQSDYEILWLRPSDTFESITASDVLDMRFTGPKEAARLGSAKSVLDCMAFYDTIV